MPQPGRPDEEFLLYPALKDLTLEVATAVFMGAARDSVDEETRTQVATAFVDCVRAGLSMVRFPVPGLRWHRGLQGRKVLEDYFRTRIPAKRASDRRGPLRGAVPRRDRRRATRSATRTSSAT